MAYRTACSHGPAFWAKFSKSRLSPFGEGRFTPPYRGFFAIENFFHISCCLFALYVRSLRWPDVLIKVCIVLSAGVFLCLFFYWVRPLVMLLIFAVSTLRGVGYIPLGAPFGRLTKPSRRSLRRKLRKKFPSGFFGVCDLRASRPHKPGPLGKSTESAPVREGGRTLQSFIANSYKFSLCFVFMRYFYKFQVFLYLNGIHVTFFFHLCW
jgi:hypothetical protein